MLGEPHVRAARALGLPERRIVYRYALRLAILPTVALLGVGIGRLLSGAVFAEIAFARPGLGRLVYEGVVGRNYPVVMGTVSRHHGALRALDPRRRPAGRAPRPPRPRAPLSALMVAEAPTVVMMCGLPASGKTTTAGRLHSRLGGALIRSCDVYEDLGISLPEWVRRTHGFTVNVAAYDTVRNRAYDEMARRLDEALATRNTFEIVTPSMGSPPSGRRSTRCVTGEGRCPCCARAAAMTPRR